MSSSISVIMTTFNQLDCLKGTIEGVLSQNLALIKEFIIADDCSSDGSSDIIKIYHEKYPDLIKPIYRKKNVGVLDNFYNALKGCSGEYVSPLGGDDLWIDNYKLEKQFFYLESNKEYSIIGSNYIQWYKGREPKSYGLAYPINGKNNINTSQLMVHNHIALQTSMFRREFVDSLPSLYNGEDGKLVLYLSSKGKVLIDTNLITTVYVISGKGLAARNVTYSDRVNNLLVKYKKAKCWNNYFDKQYDRSISNLKSDIVRHALFLSVKHFKFFKAIIFLNQCTHNSKRFRNKILFRFTKSLLKPINSYLNNLFNKMYLAAKEIPY
ncbi:MAG: hypothetical protein CMG74_07690 [Candidatus Marinimicrobia bacterium]|nr:hypothetical protein [Candidatus Neomarinimicrobiota bacterium]|tara:strand:+ start:6079 stop:7050 length:972 start_codon:yes stop_codon:yes gene_type:complete